MSYRYTKLENRLNRKCQVIVIAAVLLLATTSATSKTDANQQSQNAKNFKLQPRKEFTKPHSLTKPLYPSRLIVKFKDEAQIRAAMSEIRSSVPAGIKAVKNIRKATAKWNIKYKPLIQLTHEKIKKIETRAARSSGHTQPDLAGIVVVEIPDNTIAENVANMLLALPEVEFAYFEHKTPLPPGDITPTTPDYSYLQTYIGLNPGLDMIYAWGYESGKGAGISLLDCEYGWNEAHEDLMDRPLSLEQGQTIHPDVITYGWDSHGTAVIGQTSAVQNSYGCTGLVPDATVRTYPEWTVQQGYRRVTAIASAIADANDGDVVMLEMQTYGAGPGEYPYAPAEFEQAVWTVVKAGTDAGVIVVAAAGNGNQDLDSTAYNSYMSRGDSGAIIVGAGTSNTSHNKLSFSTYGSRVDVQAWGQSVFTLGYGSYAEHGGDKNQRYTSTFSGTSSATPLVASCCVSLQAIAVEILGRRLTPFEMRDLLITTGISQGTGGHIGPFPDMQAAIQWIEDNTDWCYGADINQDTQVDAEDFAILASQWKQVPDVPSADISPLAGGDNFVDLQDMALLIRYWLETGCTN